PARAEGAFPRRAVRLDHGRGQPAEPASLARLAADPARGSRRRGGPTRRGGEEPLLPRRPPLRLRPALLARGRTPGESPVSGVALSSRAAQLCVIDRPARPRQDGSGLIDRGAATILPGEIASFPC